MHLDHSENAARKCLAAAVCTADTDGLSYEAAWATTSMQTWFDANTATNTQAFDNIEFYILH